MAKRILCMLLALLTAMSLWAPAYAADAPEATPEPTVEPVETPEPTVEPVETPEPTAEPTATPEPTAEPTATPEPTVEPTATPEPTVEPTATPEPTVEPTATPEPTAEPTATPEPTAEPTATPEPTAEPTATPEPTVEPTATPEPTAEPTATPKPTPKPTVTPEPVEEPEEAVEEEQSAPEPELASVDAPKPLPVPKYAVENWQKVTLHYGFTSSGNYNTTEDGVRVTWKPVAGAGGYKIWRKDEGGSWQLRTTCEGGTTSWFEGVSINGGYYTYSVQSVDADGNDGVFDGTGTAIRHWKAPSVYLSASNTAKGVELSWGAVNGAVKYRIYARSKSSEPWKMLKETANKSWLWTGPAVGVNYSYALQYVDKDGYASVFNECGDQEWVYMAQPRVTSVKRGSGGVTVTWAPVSGASSYDVFYRRGTDEKWTQIRPNRYSQYYTTKDTSYTWSYSGYDSADPDTVYYFIVRANESAAYSIIHSQSVYEGTGVLSPVTGAPKITAVKNVGNNIKIEWNAISGAAKYRVFYKSSSGKWKKLADVSGTSYTWKKAASGKTYTFTVRAMTADKKYASAYNKTGKTIAHTDMPKISKAVWSGKNVKLSWSRVKGAVQYRVFYKIGDGKWHRLAETKSTSYTWTKAKSNTVYYFTVRCVDKTGQKYVSDYSGTGKLLTNSAAPRLTGAKCVDDGVRITWKKVTGAAQYRVFYKTGRGGWKRLGVTSSNSYVWRGAKSGTKYTFTVRCLSADGKSYASAYDKTGKSVTYIAAPSLSVSSASSGVKISWDKVAGAAKYRVFYKNSAGKWVKLKDTASTSYTWGGARDGVSYTFTVRCLSADGKSYTSAYDTSGKTVTYRKGGSGSSSSGSGGGSSIDWGNDDGDKRKVCWRCGGSGQRDCGTCGGSGYVTNYGSAPGMGSWHERKPCPSVTCHGGKVTCSTCGGDGWL